jgi:hypothetical protein
MITSIRGGFVVAAQIKVTCRVPGSIRRSFPVLDGLVSRYGPHLTANMSHKQWRDWVSPDIGYITACPGLPIAPG